MVNATEFLIQEAYRFAKEGKIYEAQKVLGMLHIYGLSDKVADMREEIGLAYLKDAYHPVHFGLVQHMNFRISTIYDYTHYDHAFIGLSPYATDSFGVRSPIYKKYGNSHEVLFKVGDMWVYGNFTQVNGEDDFYCGQVVSATTGRLRVIPFFETTEIKALARKAIDNLKNVGFYVWKFPEDFDMAPSEYEATQQEQTKLALAHYGLTPKE